MGDSKLVVVFGATGTQGGSVVEALLSHHGKYRVRGVTRNPGAHKARWLHERNVELVRADLSNADEIAAAMDGAYAVFALTNFWEPEIYLKDLALEEKQGKLLADAAASKNVKHFIWSGLDNVEHISGGRLEVPHFSGKYRVEQHIRKLANENKLKYTTFAYCGFFNTNLLSWFTAPHVGKNNEAVFSWPLRYDVAIPWFSPQNIGVAVLSALEDPDRWNHQIMRVASEYMTMQQATHILTEVTGRKFNFHRVSLSEFEKSLGNKTPAAEVAHMFEFFNRYGYFNGEDLTPLPGLQSFREWFQTTKWRGPEQPSREE
jgi:uncharacterized protein YbjT (DUF2867 family)